MATSNVRIIELPFPLSGVARGLSFAQQPPGTAYDAQNVRPTDSFARRRRGGSRPMLIKSHTDAAAVAGAAQALAGVSKVTSGVLSRILIEIAGGVIYSDYGSTPGDMTAVSATIVCNSALATIQCAEHAQKLYIADWGAARVTGTDGAVDSNGGVGGAGLLTSAILGAHWDDQDIVKETDVVTMYNAAGTVSLTCAISNVAAGGLTIVGPPAGDPTGLTFSVHRGIKVYDAATNTVSLLTTTLGCVPANCPCMSVFRDRLCLAGPDHVWWLSRQGDFTDWHYGDDAGDVGRAIDHTLSFSGTPGKAITAIIGHGNDCQILACEDELWIMRGDPAYGGTLSKLAPIHGIVGPSAYCDLPDFGTLFLSQDGLSVISGGCAATPAPMSRIFIPLALQNVDPTANAIALAYDPEHGGIIVSVTPTAGTAGEHWWIDWPMGAAAERLDRTGKAVSVPPSFHAILFGNLDHQATVLLNYDAGPGQPRHVLIGCHDGYVREHSDAATTDDGTAVASYVLIGPFRPAGNDYQTGMVRELIGTLAVGSASVTWELFAAATVEAVVAETTAKASGTWIAGRNNISYPRVSDGAVLLKLSSTGRWALESITAVVEAFGRQRT